MELLFHSVNNLAEFYIIFRYFTMYLGETRFPFIRVAFITACLYFGLIYINVWRNPIANSIAMTLLLLGISFLFEGHWKKRVQYIIALIGLSMAFELVLFQIFNLLGQDMLSNYYFHGFTSSLLRIVIIQIIIVKHKRSEEIIPNRLQFVMGLVWALITSFVFLFSPDVNAPELPTLRWFFQEMMLLLLSVLVFIAFEFSTRQYTSEKRTFELALRLEAQEQYYKQFAHYESEIRRYKHDISNMLLGLLAIQESERTEKIQELLEGVDNHKFHNYSENERVNLLMNKKIDPSMFYPENLQIDIRVAKTIPMDATDTAVLIGNLLDNAMNALLQVSIEERILVIKMKQTPQMVTIQIENRWVEDKLINSSKDPNRGIGLKSVKRIVEKHDGNLSIQIGGNTYRTTVKIP